MKKCNLIDLQQQEVNILGTVTIMVVVSFQIKLDRSLANMDWRISFPKAFVEILWRLHYDHNPILHRFGGLP